MTESIENQENISHIFVFTTTQNMLI